MKVRFMQLFDPSFTYIFQDCSLQMIPETNKENIFLLPSYSKKHSQKAAKTRYLSVFQFLVKFRQDSSTAVLFLVVSQRKELVLKCFSVDCIILPKMFRAPFYLV